jgi:hypothetical protein
MPYLNDLGREPGSGEQREPVSRDANLSVQGENIAIMDKRKMVDYISRHH